MTAVRAENPDRTADPIRVQVPDNPQSHPAYVAFARVVEDVFAPRATEIDRTAVPSSHIDALRSIGYFSWFVPEEYGGTNVPFTVIHAAHNLLFGADPSTATMVTQHGAPAAPAVQAGTPEALALLPKLASGELIGGAAMGHIRSWPERRGTIATRVDGGYRVNGTVGWASGWGLTDLIWLGAVNEQTEEYVFGIVDVHQVGIVGELLPLAAVYGSRTARLTLSDVFLADAFVSEVVPVKEWKAKDGLLRPDLRRAQIFHPGIQAEDLPRLPFPGPYGLARAALDDAIGLYPDDPSLQALSEELETAAVTPLPDPEWRAQLNDLAVRAATAGVVARGGAALLEDDIAQVRARAATFFQIRGVAPVVRTAHFAKYAR